MKRFFFLLATAVLSTNAFCNVLSPEAALNRVHSSNTAKHIKGINVSNPELITTFSADNQPAVYLFSRGNNNGYLVISADDMTDAILGYCDEGSIDANNMPPAMSYLLESYANQIAFARANAPEVSMASHQSPERAAIHPLCKTLWAQNSPYNDLCPNKYATGCTATAFAQVLKYFGGIQGSGTASYAWNDQTLSFDFDNYSFDWNNMLDSYDDNATLAQKDAIANLMYACGVSLQMNYKSGGSAAYAINTIKYAADLFNLDKDIRYYVRDYYGYDEWNDLIYDAIKNCGPVMLGGAIVNTSYTYAHEYVCDGYASDDLFHINWGWAGEYNGYFRLNALNPYSHGMVPSKNAYNYYQDAVCYIQPAKDNSKPFKQIYCNSFSIRNTSATLGNTVSLNGGGSNYSSCVLSGTIGMKISDLNGEFVQYAEATSDFADLAIGGSYTTAYPVRIPADIAEGTYTLTPTFKDTDGEWHDIKCKPAGVQSYTMTVADNKARFSADEYGAVQISDFKLDTPFYATKSGASSNIPFRFSAKVSSAKEYYGKVALAFFDADDAVQSTYSYVPLYIPAGETLDFELYENSSSITAGETYRMALVDGAGNVLTDFIEATVNTGAPSPAWKANISDMVIANADAVDAHDLDMTFKINCTSGFLYEAVWLCAYDSSNKIVESWEVNPVALVEGESKEYHYHADFHAATPGATYTLHSMSDVNRKWLDTDGWTFTVAPDDPASVSNICNDSDVLSTEYFNLQGVSLGSNISAAGLYIKVEKLADGSRRSSRCIIR